MTSGFDTARINCVVGFFFQLKKPACRLTKVLVYIIKESSQKGQIYVSRKEDAGEREREGREREREGGERHVIEMREDSESQ